ncbi:MAG: DUF1016 domain-containing protein [Deltaproteobacteria bacterium]|nr:DUF1016 domain-containing protein [Deltaproteobacteria bacterium]
MTKNLSKTNNYAEFLGRIKSRIAQARIRAARTVNHELTDLYWSIGKDIVEKQENLGWGKSVVEKLSGDLRKAFPGTTGFSTPNLWFMRQFYLEYRDHPNLLQLARELPWFTNVTVFTKIKKSEVRHYYLKNARDMAWSRSILLHQIKAKSFERQILTIKQHNFRKALPEPLSDHADRTMKDLYMLDFLGITERVVEREIENRMVMAIKDVILELGYGFSFIGNQHCIKAEGREYFIDLLFYHRKLRCLVAIELKVDKFEPEHAGKMNFYLNLLDDYVREEGENPSIGIILCAERDRFEVEYALRGIDKPVGVAGYQLTKTLPKTLAGKIPDAKKLKREIIRELKTS